MYGTIINVRMSSHDLLNFFLRFVMQCLIAVCSEVHKIFTVPITQLLITTNSE